jgi:hypothetical protein
MTRKSLVDNLSHIPPQASVLLQSTVGDFRDWDAISEWGQSIFSDEEYYKS